jgi:hypothetical protein
MARGDVGLCGGNAGGGGAGSTDFAAAGGGFVSGTIGGVAAGIVVSNDLGAAVPSGTVLSGMTSARAGGVAAGDAAVRGGSERAGFGGGRAGSGSVGATGPRILGSAARCDQPEDGTGFEMGSVDESPAGSNFARDAVLEASGSARVAGAWLAVGGSDGTAFAAGVSAFAAGALAFAAGPSGFVLLRWPIPRLVGRSSFSGLGAPDGGGATP